MPEIIIRQVKPKDDDGDAMWNVFIDGELQGTYATPEQACVATAYDLVVAPHIQ